MNAGSGRVQNIDQSGWLQENKCPEAGYKKIYSMPEGFCARGNSLNASRQILILFVPLDERLNVTGGDGVETTHLRIPEHRDCVEIQVRAGL